MTASDSHSNEEIARAISGHRFDVAYPYLADDVIWTLVGAGRLDGKEAFVGACEATAVADLRAGGPQARPTRPRGSGDG